MAKIPRGQKRKGTNRASEAGFALPLILTLGIILAGLVLGVLRTAISNSANSRIRLFTALSNNALDSLVSQYRALLNDATYGNLYNQFWVVQGCSSINGINCPKDTSSGLTIPSSGIQDPSRTYWGNSDGFCNDFPSQGRNDCPGRQISPTCSYDNPNDNSRAGYLNWWAYQNEVNSFLNTQKNIGSGVGIGGGNQTYGNIGTYNTVGQIEKGGRSHLDLTGYVKGVGNTLRAERRARISMEVERNTPYSGFAYIAAGMRQADKNAIHLANLQVFDQTYTAGNVGRGTILLRRNMSNWHSSLLDPSNCSGTRDIFFYANSAADSFSLPRKGNGGLLVHSSYWPGASNLDTPPSSANTVIVRTIGLNNCLRVNSQTQRVYEYNNLFVLRGATYCVETSDNSKALIKIADSLDIAPGARFCHIAQGSSVCGSGKPENLTLVSAFRDYSTGLDPVSDDTGCSNNRGGEGVGESYAPRSRNGRPGPSFTFRNTGNRANGEMVSAFIYGKDLIFNSSGVHRGRTGTYLSNELDTNYGRYSGSLVIHRSRIAATALGGTSDGRVWRLIYPNGNVAIQGDSSRTSLNRMNDGETGYLARKAIIAIADRTDYGRSYGAEPSVYITYDWTQNRFDLNSFYRLNNPAYGSTEGQIQLGGLVGREVWTPWGIIRRSFYPWELGNYRTVLKLMYGISITSPTQEDMTPVRVYKGAVWARKVCFSRNWAYGDYLRTHHWIFDPSFVDGLSKRYGEEFRWGFSNYKSRFIKTWDILRDLFS